MPFLQIARFNYRFSKLKRFIQYISHASQAFQRGLYNFVVNSRVDPSLPLGKDVLQAWSLVSS
jgi:hypothetical protein